MIDLMQSMNPVLHVALLFTLFCYALAVCMALWRLLRGPEVVDRVLAHRAGIEYNEVGFLRRRRL